LSAEGPILAAVDGVRIRVRLTPSGGADRIEGAAVDAAGEAHLKARVRAAPENGAANAALEAMLAKSLGRPKSDVSVERGHTARIKIVAAAGVSLEEAISKRLGDRP